MYVEPLTAHLDARPPQTIPRGARLGAPRKAPPHGLAFAPRQRSSSLRGLFFAPLRPGGRRGAAAAGGGQGGVRGGKGSRDLAREEEYHCPACTQLFRKAWKLKSHLEVCAPDAYSGGDWEGVTQAKAGDEAGAMTYRAAVGRALGRSAEREKAQREVLMRHAFGDGPSGFAVGQQRTNEEIAVLMGLTPERVRCLLRQAIREVPLVADHDPLDVLYEDDELLVVDKPPGVRAGPVHRFVGGSLLNRAIGHLGGAQPWVVHRLDMYTSGVTVFAKTKGGAANLAGQFSSKTARKTYIALAAGVPGGGAWTCDAPLGKAPGHAFAQAVVEGGQESSTGFEVAAASKDADVGGAAGGLQWAELAPPGMGSSRGASLVVASPLTGRTHQIRVHLASSGHPIIGDDIYGCVVPSLMPRQALHAARLQLVHPGTGEKVAFAAPFPADFAHCMRELGIPRPDMSAVFEAGAGAGAEAGACRSGEGSGGAVV